MTVCPLSTYKEVLWCKYVSTRGCNRMDLAFELFTFRAAKWMRCLGLDKEQQ